MKDLPQRKRTRLKGYDYSRNGGYFITICTKNREFLFGDIADGVMILNEYGEIVQQELKITEQKRPYLHLDNYVIMPNHVHILISLCHDYVAGTADYDAGTARRAPTSEQFGKPTKESIPTVIRSFKAAATNAIRKHVGARRAVPADLPDVYAVWQRNYHDHIIRNSKSYQHIFNYIENNPMRWESDCHNPANLKYADWNNQAE